MKRLEELGISPAPWRVSDAQHYWVDDTNGKMVCDGLTFRGNDENADAEERANARLIAAAPELYECLREAVLEMCHECLSCGGYPSYKCKDPNDRCFLAKWRAALAEAAGEEVRDEQAS